MTSLLIVLLLSAVLTVVLVTFVMALALLRPPRMTDGKALRILRRIDPSDLGLKFEPMTFNVRDVGSGDPLQIAGWWIPHPAARGRCVILLHGYADAKVGAIAWAPLLHAFEFNVLAIDLRAHGESEGTMISAGYFERHDVSDVINQLRAARPAETETLVLMGLSLGCATAAAVAAMRDDIAGVILESPYSSFAQGTRVHGRLIGLPGEPIQRLALWLAGIISGAKLDEVRPSDLVPRLRCAVLVVFGSLDPFIEREAFKQSRNVRLLEIEGAGHLAGMAMNPEEYAREVGRFLLALPDGNG